MAEFMLRGPAQVWMDMIRESQLVEEKMTWGDFYDHFLAEYQPDSLRERWAFEFEGLTCLSCGSVDAYTHRFIELYGYAPTLVAIDRQKARRFVWGIPMSIQKKLLRHLDLTFTEAIDQAW